MHAVCLLFPVAYTHPAMQRLCRGLRALRSVELVLHFHCVITESLLDEPVVCPQCQTTACAHNWGLDSCCSFVFVLADVFHSRAMMFAGLDSDMMGWSVLVGDAAGMLCAGMMRMPYVSTQHQQWVVLHSLPLLRLAEAHCALTRLPLL